MDNLEQIKLALNHILRSLQEPITFSISEFVLYAFKKGTWFHPLYHSQFVQHLSLLRHTTAIVLSALHSIPHSCCLQSFLKGKRGYWRNNNLSNLDQSIEKTATVAKPVEKAVCLTLHELPVKTQVDCYTCVLVQAIRIVFSWKVDPRAWLDLETVVSFIVKGAVLSSANLEESSVVF